MRTLSTRAPGQPQIVLTWLIRLRWLAVASQLSATLLADVMFNIRPPWAAIGAVIAVAVLSNLGLLVWTRSGTIRPVAISAIILLDVALLTALLYLTGGPDNPFTVLYLVHVALAVTALNVRLTWLVVSAAVAGYGLLIIYHQPLSRGDAVSLKVLETSRWFGLLLVASLIAYFVGRIARALNERESELEAFRLRATRNEQLAALTTLAAGAAHELGTPLGTIAVVAKDLEIATREASATMAEDARLIRQEVDRCRNILARMRFDIAVEAAREMPVPVSTLLNRLRNDLSTYEVSRLQIDHRLVDDVPVLSARAVQQALLVLVRNAFDACPKDAMVALRIERRENRLVFQVVDNGPGMAPDVLRHVGEPFFTTKEPGRGMGLGIFLVRLVAERVEGDFSIQSEPGKGTRATLEVSIPGDTVSP